jgi:membrane protein implicated in regulation of membrane protease activity
MKVGRLLLIGAGLAVLAPVAVAALAGVARPVARAALRSGMLAYDKGREAVAEMGEVVEDLVAEVRVEMDEIRAEAATTTAEKAGDDSAS